MNLYEIEWSAWPEGARIPSRGCEQVWGMDGGDAWMKLKAAYPGIQRMDSIRRVKRETTGDTER